MLIEGKWLEDDAARRNSADGSFARPASAFRGRVAGDSAAEFPAAAGRYHLFIAPSCPWAHRTAIARRLKGLDGVVGLTLAELPRIEGWTGSSGIDELQPVDGRFYIHRLYTTAQPDYTGRVTVPVLWDRQTRRIVNNESAEIIRIFNSGFGALAGMPFDLYPEALRPEIDRINDFVYEHINNGVYRAGFARTQEAYDAACRKVFQGLDELEQRLSTQRYLLGRRLTEADVRLFPTLVRFDSVYYSHFKCNLKRLADYPNLDGYMRDLYMRPAFGDTVDIEAIKRGYYGGQKNVNPTGIVPLGPHIDFTRPHGRDALGPA
ncbi:MAG TPA: glutathione S-transferase family protein [Burkholderiales bacterium]|nr:glutathione S-transferase family protein [Burkholderiales bacterium]